MFSITDMPLFAHLDERSVDVVRSLGTGIRVPAGTSLARQGTLARECMLICAGTVVVGRHELQQTVERSARERAPYRDDVDSVVEHVVGQ